MAPPSDNVWVGDLPVGMDKGTLANLFEPYGTVVECRVMAGRDESAKPCAMVRFVSVEIAAWVVENINGNIPEGLNEPVVCRFANDNKGKGDGKAGKGDKFGAAQGGYAKGGYEPYGGGKGKGAAKAGFEPPTPSDNVWVGDLPVGTEKDHLGSIFEPYGQIVDCRILPGRDESAKPCAMIRFASVEIAQWVVENLNGNIPQGLDGAIIARFANASKKGAGKDAGAGKAAWGGGKAAAQPWQVEPTWGGGGGKSWDKNGGKDAWGGGDKGGAGGKGKKSAAPGSFQALFQSAKGGGLLGGGNVPEDCQIFIKNLPSDTTDYDLYKLFSPFGAIPPSGVKAMKGDDGVSCKGVGFVDFSDPSSAATAVMALNDHTTPDGSTIGVSTKKPSKGKGEKGDKGKGKGGKGKHEAWE